MTAPVAAARFSPELVASLGWCPACYVEGRQVPSALSVGPCTAHLRTMAARPVLPGQGALIDVAPVPRSRRARYATGVQVDCVVCVAAGVPRPRLGMPERTPGDARPLCVPCWRAGQARQPAADEPLGPAQRSAVEALAASLEDSCEVCGRADRPESCWRCGFAWKAQARAVHEWEQAEAARDGQRAAELAQAERDARAEVGWARQRLADVEGWLARVQRVADAAPSLARTGARGALQVKRRAGREAAVLCRIADFLHRHHQGRQAVATSGRGRPPRTPRVAAAMAIDANLVSGRKAMPGLERTAWLAGVSARTVTNGFRETRALRWSHLVVAGGLCSLEDRRELGRSRHRAEFDLRPLWRSRFDDYAPYLGQAAGLVAELLQRAVVLVDEARAELHAAQAAADRAAAAAADATARVAERTAEDLAWRVELAAGELAEAWAADATEAAATARRLRGLAVARATPHPRHPGPAGAAHRAAVVAPSRLSVTAAAQHHVRKAAETAVEQAIRLSNFCHPPGGCSGERFSSGPYLGLWFSPRSSCTQAGGHRRPRRGRGEGQHLIGASRSSTERVAAPPVSRPRTTEGEYGAPPHRRRPAAWSWWATPLALRLRSRLACLRTHDITVPQIAAVLGPRLSPDWTVDDVVALLERHAGVRSLLGQGDAHSPLRYLAALLDRALTNPDAQLPARSPVRDRMRRAAAAGLAARRAEWDAQAAAAAAERGGPGAARLAALAAAANAKRPARRRRFPDAPAETAPGEQGWA